MTEGERDVAALLRRVHALEDALRLTACARAVLAMGPGCTAAFLVGGDTKGGRWRDRADLLVGWRGKRGPRFATAVAWTNALRIAGEPRSIIENVRCGLCGGLCRSDMDEWVSGHPLSGLLPR